MEERGASRVHLRIDGGLADTAWYRSRNFEALCVHICIWLTLLVVLVELRGGGDPKPKPNGDGIGCGNVVFMLRDRDRRSGGKRECVRGAGRQKRL